MIRRLFVIAVLLTSFKVSAVAPTFSKATFGVCTGAGFGGVFTAICGGTGKTFSYTANGTGNGVIFQVVCTPTDTTTPSAVSLTGTGWTFTQLGSVIGTSGPTTGFAALFKAYAPNTTAVTLTINWTGVTNCSNYQDVLIEEWSGVEPTNFVDSFVGSQNATVGTCATPTITPVTNDCGLISFCNDNATAGGAGWTVPTNGNDSSGDMIEHKILTGGAGASQSVVWGAGVNAPYTSWLVAVTATSTGGPPGPLTTTTQGTTRLILRSKGQ